MHPAIQLNISVPNVPSSLAKVCDRLRSSNVNISAISCTEGHPSTTIHMVLDDLETAKIVLKDLGHVTTTDVLAIKVKNTPGVLAMIGRECAAAGINIRTIYATTCGKEAMVYVSVEDSKAAMELMKHWKEKITQHGA